MSLNPFDDKQVSKIAFKPIEEKKNNPPAGLEIINIGPPPKGESPLITKELEIPDEPSVMGGASYEANLELPCEPEHSRILREHGGLESNIPIHHRYWRIRP